METLFQGPGRGISMSNGTLVFAGQFKDKDQVPHSTIIYSKVPLLIEIPLPGPWKKSLHSGFLI